MTLISRFALPLAAALAVMAGWSWHMQQRGVQREKVRVEAIGKKLDAKAGEARRKVAAKPPSEVQADLRRYCVDC
jgi:hypothetical protein